MKKFLGVYILVATVLVVVKATKIKISLDLLDNANVTSANVTSKVFVPGCTDKQVKLIAAIADQKLKTLKTHRDEVEFYTSLNTKANLEAAVIKKVAGTQKTAKEFLVEMRAKGCHTYIYGGAVRDALLGLSTIKDIDAETDCTLEMVYKICKDKFTEQLCFKIGRYPASLINFGSKEFTAEMVDLASNKNTFYGSKEYLEYTPNAVAYDYGGEDVVIALSGTGVIDACAKQIGIPVEDDKRGTWADKTDKIGKKIFRYWKLIAKGFQPANSEVKKYVVQRANAFIDDNDWIAMKNYYCRMMYGAPMKDYTGGKGCENTKVNCQVETLQTKAKAFRDGTAADLKNSWKPPPCGDPAWNFQ